MPEAQRKIIVAYNGRVANKIGWIDKNGIGPLETSFPTQMTPDVAMLNLRLEGGFVCVDFLDGSDDKPLEDRIIRTIIVPSGADKFVVQVENREQQ